MDNDRLSIFFPHERCTFYFVSQQQMEQFISYHVRTGKDGLPFLYRTGLKYKTGNEYIYR